MKSSAAYQPLQFRVPDSFPPVVLQNPKQQRPWQSLAAAYWPRANNLLESLGAPRFEGGGILERRHFLYELEMLVGSLSEREKYRLARAFSNVAICEPPARVIAVEGCDLYYAPSVGQAAAKILFENISLMPEYEEFQRQREHVFYERLLNDSQVQEAGRDWNHYYDLDRKKGFLVFFANIQDDVFSSDGLRFRPFKAVHFDGRSRWAGSFSKGAACFSGKQIAFFGEMCGFVAHEKKHDHQFQMACASRKGLIPVSSPLYRQGQRFTKFFTESGLLIRYVLPSKYHWANYAHPIERDARATANAIRFLDQRLALEESKRAWRSRVAALKALPASLSL